MADAARIFAPGDAALDVVSPMLAGGKNSRLYKRLVYDMQIAQDVTAFQASQALDSQFQIVVTRAARAHGRRSCRRSIDEEIAEAAAGAAGRARVRSARSTRSRRRSTTGWSASAASAARPIS